MNRQPDTVKLIGAFLQPSGLNYPKNSFFDLFVCRKTGVPPILS
jgi:hypothetical protein